MHFSSLFYIDLSFRTPFGFFLINKLLLSNIRVESSTGFLEHYFGARQKNLYLDYLIIIPFPLQPFP